MRFNVVGVPVAAIYPRVPRDIYQGGSISLYGRFTSERRFTMRLSGLNRGERYDFSFTLNFADARAGDETLARRWAVQKLHALYSRIIEQGRTEQIQAEIDALERRYDIESMY